jgi:Gpi18-like mannosyltransferase
LIWLKKFLPFLGISTLFLSLILLIVILFNYYDPASISWARRINPFYLLLRWDSFHYLDIILKGYSGPSVFFPLYPLVVFCFSIFFNTILAGFLVSLLSLAGALYYFSLLLENTGNEKIKSRTIILLLSFPTAMFFPIIYTESLFLLLTISFFFYIQKRNWLVAALIGFLATLTRNVGVFLWPVYLVSLFIAFYNSSLGNFSQQIIALIKKREFWYSWIVPAGLFIFCLYSYWQFGGFFSFISGQKGWNIWRSFTWPGVSLYNFFKIIFLNSISETGPYNFLRIIVFEGGSFLLLLIATIYWIVKKNWPYVVLCLLNTMLFSCLNPMLSANRYVVVIFPIFIFLAAATKKNNWLFYTIMALFFVFFVFNVYLFSIGSWVG